MVTKLKFVCYLFECLVKEEMEATAPEYYREFGFESLMDASVRSVGSYGSGKRICA
jgi:hypothetical protein